MESDRELRNSTDAITAGRKERLSIPTCSPLDERIGGGPGLERRRKEHGLDCVVG